jgi:hypothetical protein
MCSILGVSFAPGSTINRKKFAGALLAEGRVRGRDASGYAWVSDTDNGMYKLNVPGDQLYTGNIPQDANAIILHTRAATHGKASENENNHPIQSQNGNVRLVHNGVIWNHEDVRTYFDKATQKALPDVDSSVIAEVIDQYGLEQTEIIEGDAAVAWFDAETGSTIHLARFQNSPVVYTTLADGSFVFASTAQILGNALKELGIPFIGQYPEVFSKMDESEYFQIVDGEVFYTGKTEWGDEFSSRAQYNSHYRATTSGATTQQGGYQSQYTSLYSPPAQSITPGAQEPNKTVGNPNPVGFGAGVQKAIEVGQQESAKKEEVKTSIVNPDKKPVRATGESESAFSARMGAWEDKQGASKSVSKGSEDASFTSGPTFDPNNDDPEWVDTAMALAMEEWESDDPYRTTFFAWGHDGDYTTYKTLTGLIAYLSWVSDMKGGENFLAGPEDGKERWVNWVADIGHLSEDETDELSWVKTPGAFDDYGQGLPAWISDGIGKLKNLVGA